jgi:beta-lactamase regulating signal transducer with metallopeptidase domain/HEAT repeat protein
MNGLIHWLNEVSPVWWVQIAHGTWQAALVPGLLLGLVAWKRRWPAPWRYGLLVLALLKFAVPPLFPLPTGILSRVVTQVRVNPASPVTAAAQTSRRAPNEIGEAEPAFAGNRVSRFAAAPELNSEPFLRAERANRRTPAATKLSWISWLLMLYSLGGLAVAGWVGWQLTRLHRWIRSGRIVSEGAPRQILRELAENLGLRRVPQLRLSEKAQAPVAFGVLQPTILLPAAALDRLPQAELRTILAHELAHFRRGDPWINWLQIILQAVWWFHPVSWLLNRAIRKVREDCCDDLLLARGLASSEAYCDTLLRAATEFAPAGPVAVTLGFGERLHPLGRRLGRIMDHTLPHTHRLPALGLLTVCLLGGLLLPGLRSQTVEVSKPGQAVLPPAKSAVLTQTQPAAPVDLAAAALPSAKDQISTDAPKSLSELFDELTLDFIKHDRHQTRLRDVLRQRGGPAIDFLTNELTNLGQPDRMRAANRRKKAAWLLGQLGPMTSGVVPALLRSLEDEDDDVGRSAASALRDIGPRAKAAVPALIEAMRFKNISAGQALAAIAPESETVAQAMLEVFTDISQPQDLREQLTYALSELKTHKPEIEQALVAAYEQFSGYLQESVASSLARIQPRTSEGRNIVRRSLIKRRNESRALPSPSPEQIQEYIAQLKSPADEFKRLHAMNALRNAGVAARDAVPWLSDLLKDSNYRYRYSAASALGAIGEQAKEGVPALIAALEDTDGGLRINALAALGGIGKGASAAIPVMVGLLNSTDGWERFYAAYGLWRMDPARLPVVLPLFLDMAQAKPPTSPNQWMLAKTFGEIGPPAKPAIPAIASWLTQADGMLGFQIAETLWRIDPGEATRILPVLESFIEDDLCPRRLEAAKLLAEMGASAKPAVPVLEKYLQDEDSDFRVAVTNALHAIRSASAKS